MFISNSYGVQSLQEFRGSFWYYSPVQGPNGLGFLGFRTRIDTILLRTRCLGRLDTAILLQKFAHLSRSLSSFEQLNFFNVGEWGPSINRMEQPSAIMLSSPRISHLLSYCKDFG